MTNEINIMHDLINYLQLNNELMYNEKIIECIQAIENILKELNEKNKRNKELNEKLIDLNEHYISKDKIKEKIEKLNKQANEYEENEKDIAFKTFWHNELLKVTHQKWILEEILK